VAFAYKADVAYGTRLATAAGADLAKLKAFADTLAD
jgi:hypothetical protein